MIGHVYVIQEGDDGPFKIGWCRSFPHDRLKTLQTGNPRELHLRGAYAGTQKDEQQLHRLLREHNIRGEWFEPVEVLKRIATCDLDGCYAISDLDPNILHYATYQGGEAINRQWWAASRANEQQRARRAQKQAAAA